MQPERKIIQIIPAEGWVARYRVDGEGVPVITGPVLCFALCEDEDGLQDVQPMEYGDRYAEFCDAQSNFEGILRKDETES